MKWTEKNSLGVLPLFRSLSSADCSHRLKKVQGKKKRDDAARAIEKVDVDDSTLIDEAAGGSSNMLSTKDDDVIF
jgi:hypothetical protein